MLCKLTGQEGRPAKAHIIPKAFYLIDKAEKRPLKIVSSDDGVHPKKSRVGIYDDSIVTQEGEKRFLKWDDYAAKLLINNTDQRKPVLHPETQEILGYSIADYDYHKLMLFFISLLWRAGVSSRPEFNSVNLGPHADVLKELILTENPASSEDYAVLLAIFHDATKWATIMSPFPERYDGIKCYRFYLGNIIAYIKVDQQKYKDPMSYLQMHPKQPLFLIAREFWGSKESKLLRDVVRKTTF